MSDIANGTDCRTASSEDEITKLKLGTVVNFLVHTWKLSWASISSCIQEGSKEIV